MSAKPLITVLAAFVVLALPGEAAVAAPANHHGAQTEQTSGYTDPLGPAMPGPGDSHRQKSKAYGKYCAEMSRKHVAGHSGTPFSQCVNALAKLSHGTRTNPAKVCAALSRKHAKGQRRTPFSRCVTAAARLQRQLAA